MYRMGRKRTLANLLSDLQLPENISAGASTPLQPAAPRILWGAMLHFSNCLEFFSIPFFRVVHIFECLARVIKHNKILPQAINFSVQIKTPPAAVLKIMQAHRNILNILTRIFNVNILPRPTPNKHDLKGLRWKNDNVGVGYFGGMEWGHVQLRLDLLLEVFGNLTGAIRADVELRNSDWNTQYQRKESGIMGWGHTKDKVCPSHAKTLACAGDNSGGLLLVISTHHSMRGGGVYRVDKNYSRHKFWKNFPLLWASSQNDSNWLGNGLKCSKMKNFP